MRKVIIALTISVFGAMSARAEIIVEIVNMPSEVYSFGPAYVLYAVENRGPAPVVLPAGAAPERGVGVYTGPAGKEPSPPPGPDALYVSPGASGMWLSPGERWLFYTDIGWALGVLEGEVSVQAVLSSNGLCGAPQLYGRRSYRWPPRIPGNPNDTRIAPPVVYPCWRGEARSTIWNVTVRQPTDPIDRAAFQYLKTHRGLTFNSERSTWSLSWPLDGHMEYKRRFGESHYSYVLEGPLNGGRGPIDQPDHPMNPWVLADLAQSQLEKQSSCYEPRKMGSLARAQAEQRDADLDRAIKSVKFPAGVQDYLDQYRWWLENRHCPLLVQSRTRPKGSQP